MFAEVETRILYIDPENFDDSQIETAAEAIKSDGVVAFPTETVYGLGCSTKSDAAVERLFELKHRDRAKPMAICLASVTQLDQYRPEIYETAKRIIDNFLPGPLTIILRCEDEQLLGFRIPDYELLRQLITLSGVPIFATSANISGQKEPTTATEILDVFSQGIDVVIDAGPARLGAPSTVIDLTTDRPKLVREGALPRQDIEELIGIKLDL